MKFSLAREATFENIEALQTSLAQCVNGGMLDLEDTYYDALGALLEDARVVANWDELEEVITRAKTLETDVAAWLSMQGRTSLSLPWPRPDP
ncbi:MAG: hypothetical protein HY861_03535 [Chlamydiia bacterium]|nr:hypothetical protein [Chlamydiia bacterium]